MTGAQRKRRVTTAALESPGRSSQRRDARRARAFEESILPPLVALLIAAVVGDILILIFGQSPGDGLPPAARGHVGQRLRLRAGASTRRRRSTFTGLAVAIGIRAGLFNIGAESQLASGGFLAALVGLRAASGHAGAARHAALPASRPALGGGVVGAVPGVLKARFGATK